MSAMTRKFREGQRALARAFSKTPKAAEKKLAKAAELEAQYPALQMYAPYMSPEEYFGALRGNAPATIQQLVEVLPKAQEMAAVAKFGAAKKGWYAHSAKALRDVFGEEAPRFAALLASMSPQTSVRENLKNTLAVWEKWKAAGSPTDQRQIQQAFVDALGSEQAEGMKAWTNNGTRALQAPLEILVNSGSDRLVLSGPKVDSFMRNLRDEVNAVTNDAWMANYMFGGQAGALREAGLMTGKQVPQKFFSGGINKGMTDPGIRPGYIAGSVMQRRAADMLGWDPREAQETIWSAVKPGYELAEKLGVSSRELLDRGLLTPDVIRGTPDFSTYLKDDFFRPYLERSGYGDQLDALQPAQWDEALPELSLSEQNYVDRAMGRLDKLRKERAKGILSTAGAGVVGVGALTESDDAEAAWFRGLPRPGHGYKRAEVADMRARQLEAAKQLSAGEDPQRVLDETGWELDLIPRAYGSYPQDGGMPRVTRPADLFRRDPARIAPLLAREVPTWGPGTSENLRGALGGLDPSMRATGQPFTTAEAKVLEKEMLEDAFGALRGDPRPSYAVDFGDIAQMPDLFREVPDLQRAPVYASDVSPGQFGRDLISQARRGIRGADEGFLGFDWRDVTGLPVYRDEPFAGVWEPTPIMSHELDHWAMSMATNPSEFRTVYGNNFTPYLERPTELRARAAQLRSVDGSEVPDVQRRPLLDIVDDLYRAAKDKSAPISQRFWSKDDPRGLTLKEPWTYRDGGGQQQLPFPKIVPGAAAGAVGLGVLALPPENEAEAAKLPRQLFDWREGAGNIPTGADIGYRGFEREMRPSEFLDVAADLNKDGGPSSVSLDYLQHEVLDRGKPIAPPMLWADWDPDAGQWLAREHEGRHRALTLRDKFGDGDTMPVGIVPTGMRARDITDTMRTAPIRKAPGVPAVAGGAVGLGALTMGSPEAQAMSHATPYGDQAAQSYVDQDPLGNIAKGVTAGTLGAAPDIVMSTNPLLPLMEAIRGEEYPSITEDVYDWLGGDEESNLGALAQIVAPFGTFPNVRRAGSKALQQVRRKIGALVEEY